MKLSTLHLLGAWVCLVTIIISTHTLFVSPNGLSIVSLVMGISLLPVNLIMRQSYLKDER